MNILSKEKNMEIVNVFNNHYMVECDDNSFFVFYVNDFTIQNLRNKKENYLKVCVLDDDVDSIDLVNIKDNSNHFIELNHIIKMLSKYKRNIKVEDIYKNNIKNTFERTVNNSQTF